MNTRISASEGLDRASADQLPAARPGAGRSVLLLLILAMAAVECVAEAAQDAVAADCALQHRVEHTVHYNGGLYTEQAVIAVPLSITIPAGVDAAGYAGCLQQAGVLQGNEVEAYVDRLAACRAAQPPRTVVRIAETDGAGRIGGVDQAALDACIEGRIEVEAFLPESP